MSRVIIRGLQIVFYSKLVYFALPAFYQANFVTTCSSSYMQKIISKYNLRNKVQAQHQTYALGIKEVKDIIT